LGNTNRPTLAYMHTYVHTYLLTCLLACLLLNIAAVTPVAIMNDFHINMKIIQWFESCILHRQRQRISSYLYYIIRLFRVNGHFKVDDTPAKMYLHVPTSWRTCTVNSVSGLRLIKSTAILPLSVSSIHSLVPASATAVTFTDAL